VRSSSFIKFNPGYFWQSRMPAVSAHKTPHQRPTKESSDRKSTSLLGSLKTNYTNQCDPVCRLLDVYLLFCLANGILTAIYYLAAGSFNYNAFLGSFISSVGSFVFAGTAKNILPMRHTDFLANLRLKCSLPSKGTSLLTSYIAEYICGIVILNLFIANFI
jgi:hypothetical protein